MGKPVVDYWTEGREVTVTVYVDEDKVDWGYEYWMDKEFMGNLQQEFVKAHRKAEDEGNY